MKKYVCNHCVAGDPCTAITSEIPTSCLYADSGTPEWIEQSPDCKLQIFMELLLYARLSKKARKEIIIKYLEAK